MVNRYAHPDSLDIIGCDLNHKMAAVQVPPPAPYTRSTDFLAWSAFADPAVLPRVWDLDYPFTVPGLGSGTQVLLPVWSLHLPGLTRAGGFVQFANKVLIALP